MRQRGKCGLHGVGSTRADELEGQRADLPCMYMHMYMCMCMYMVYGIWYVVYGMWYVVYGMWYMVCGMWYMVYGMWYVVYGIWYVVYGTCIWWRMSSRDREQTAEAFTAPFVFSSTHVGRCEAE